MQGLKLACCNLRGLPDALCAMGELRSLDVSMNENLDALPLGCYLDNLECLDVSRCGFSKVRANSFSQNIHHSPVRSTIQCCPKAHIRQHCLDPWVCNLC
jgi:hypothetical protein